MTTLVWAVLGWLVSGTAVVLAWIMLVAWARSRGRRAARGSKGL